MPISWIRRVNLTGIAAVDGPHCTIECRTGSSIAPAVPGSRSECVEKRFGRGASRIAQARDADMSTRTRNRVVRAVTGALWERDKLQMRMIDALLPPARPLRKRTRPARRAPRTRR